MSSRYLDNEASTSQLNYEIAEEIQKDNNDFEIHLYGELGTGKTFLTKAVLKALGYHEIVKVLHILCVRNMKHQSFYACMQIFIAWKIHKKLMF